MPLMCKGLGYRYDGPSGCALRDVSFSMEPGESVGLAGRSGSGKTTLVRCLAGQLMPSEGCVEVDGQMLDRAPTTRRYFARRVGIVAQLPERQLFGQTVYEDVAFGPRNDACPDEEVDRRVRRALDEVGFDYARSLEASPFELSGGEQRRIAIAGILALDPTYLVLDEPTAGLDPEGRDSLIAVVRELVDSGVGVVLVSHDMDLLAENVQRLAVLDSGRLVLDGPVRDAFSDSQAIEDAGLALPLAARVRRDLVGRGIVLPEDAVTVDALVGALKGQVRDGGGGCSPDCVGMEARRMPADADGASAAGCGGADASAGVDASMKPDDAFPSEGSGSGPDGRGWGR